MELEYHPRDKSIFKSNRKNRRECWSGKLVYSSPAACVQGHSYGSQKPPFLPLSTGWRWSQLYSWHYSSHFYKKKDIQKGFIPKVPYYNDATVLFSSSWLIFYESNSAGSNYNQYKWNKCTYSVRQFIIMNSFLLFSSINWHQPENQTSLYCRLHFLYEMLYVGLKAPVKQISPYKRF